MKTVFSKLDNIHELTYIFFIICLEVGIITLLLSIYYTTYAYTFANTIYFLRVGKELLLSARDLLIEAVIYSIMIEFVLRHK